MPDSILDALPDPVVVVRDGIVRRINGKMAALLRVDRDVVEGRTLEDLVETLPDLHAASDDAGASVRLVFRPPDGARVALDVRVGQAPDEEGLDLVLVCHDATEAASLHETIGQLSALYVTRRSAAMIDLDSLLRESRPVFEGLGWNIGLWEIDSAHATLRYSYFALPEGVSLGPSASLIRALEGRRLPLEKVPRVAEVVRNRRGVFASNLPQIGAALLSKLDLKSEDVEGQMKEAGFLRGAFAPVFVQERVRYVLLVSGQRLSERDFAAVQLFAAMISAAEQVSELGEEVARQERHAALGQMATQVAHEVRNPLAVLFQVTSQMRRRLGLGEDVDDLLTMVDQESRRLSRLVDDLVHFAAPLVPRIREVHLSTIVRQTIESLQSEPLERIEECVRVSPGLDDHSVLADPILLRQALAHLLTNACAFAGDEGHVELTAQREGKRVRLKVCNSGPPLSAEVARRVFEPFFTTKAVGSGLGLAVVRRLVEDIGGRVTLDPSDDSIVFSVWLPAAKPTTTTP